MGVSTTVLLGLVHQASQRWWAWLLLYSALSAAAFTFFRTPNGVELIFPGSGIALAALLTMPNNPRATLGFLLSAGVIDWLLKLTLTELTPLLGALLSFTLMLQAGLAAFLVKRFSPDSVDPAQVSSVLGFLWWGCLIPVACSALLVAAFNWLLMAGPPLYTWLSWFSLRGLSTLLIAPALLFLISVASQPPGARVIRRKLESVITLVVIVLATAFLFRTDNPDGRALATYSFLLVPLMIWCAIRLEFVVSAVMTLAVALTAIWFDADLGRGAPDVAQRSLIAVSVFLAINQVMVLLLAALVGDRHHAIDRAKRLSRMYETLSRINQTLVQADYGEQTLFEKIGRIVTRESEFDQACIATRDPGSKDGFRCRLAVRKEGDRFEVITDPAGTCGPIGHVIRTQQATFLNDAHTGTTLCSGDFGSSREEWGSIAGLPIFRGGSLYAVLLVFHKEPGIFDDDTTRLMNEMTLDISFALDNLERDQHLKLTAEVFEHSRESIMITDARGHILSVNRSFSVSSGYDEAEVTGKHIDLLKSGHQDEAFFKTLWQTVDNQSYWFGDLWSRAKNGDAFPQRGTISAVRDDQGNTLRYIAIMEDISQHIEAEQQIQKLANYDALTGLPNRILLQDRFAQAVHISNREGLGLALLFLDLDDFKHVNDAMGHAYGDELLCAVSHRLQEHLRETDTLARFGGDEFVLLAHGGPGEAALLADRLMAASAKPYQVGGQALTIGASIGIALYPDNKDNLNELIQCADAAMYRAKSKGRGTFEFYSPDMQENAQEKLEVKKELREALESEQLSLYYQPQVDVASGRVIGLEALIRWHHPERGMISPGLFIPLAEESGQIVAVDQWVLEATIRQISQWQQAGLPPVPVAINVSLAQFLRRDLVSELKAMLDNYQVAPELLELELTERIAIADNHYTIETLTALHNLGVKLSLDDFGTGYSSLSYLRRYPVDTLKIDMSFIRALDENPENQGIVRTIIGLAKSLNLNVIAEGVETQSQLNFLRQQQCDAYQGYYFSKPLPVGELLELLNPAA